MRTRSVFDRSPMILRTGSGSRRSSVGMATICSPWASCGRSSRSMTSIEYLPGEVLLADLAQVGERGRRPRRLPGDVEPKLPRVSACHCSSVIAVPLASTRQRTPDPVGRRRGSGCRRLITNSRTWFEWAMPRAFWT